MIRSLPLALLCVLALACSKKKEAPPAETPPVDKGTPGEVADDTPPEKLPDKPSSPPAVETVPVDCERLLTADDVAKACGLKSADLEVRKHAMESGKAATTCVRQAGLKVKSVSSLHFALNSAPGSPDGAKALLELSKDSEGTKPVAGVGDGAYLHVREVAAAKQTTHDLEVAKGALWFKLGYEVSKGEKKPLCSDDGLVELGKTVAGRLP